MININIGYEQSDEIMRQILLDSYETVLDNQMTYYNHPDDVRHHAEILHAISVLMDYISIGDAGQKALEAIHDKYRFKKMIKDGMSNAGGNH